MVHFWAAWCEPCAFLDSVLAQLAADAPAVAALRVEAEEAADVSERYGVSVVPQFLFFQDGQVADSLEGADAAALSTKFQALAAGGAAGGAAAAPAPAAAAAQPAAVGSGQASLQERLRQLVSQQPVMLFMKVRLGGWELSFCWVLPAGLPLPACKLPPCPCLHAACTLPRHACQLPACLCAACMPCLPCLHASCMPCLHARHCGGPRMGDENG